MQRLLTSLGNTINNRVLGSRTLFVAPILGLVITMATSCGVSRSTDEAVRAVVNDFETKWKLGKVEQIYTDADPMFKTVEPSLARWLSWKRQIDDRWGALRSIEVLSTRRMVVGLSEYWVETRNQYEKGSTAGAFIVIVGSPTRLGAVMPVEAPKNPPMTSPPDRK